MSLFPRADLETFGFGLRPNEKELLRGLDHLARLQHLHRTGYWAALRESNVEQSFVERVFAEVFGYRTLLGGASGEKHVNHEVMPKRWSQRPSRSRSTSARSRVSTCSVDARSRGLCLQHRQGDLGHVLDAH